MNPEEHRIIAQLALISLVSVTAICMLIGVFAALSMMRITRYKRQMAAYVRPVKFPDRYRERILTENEPIYTVPQITFEEDYSIVGRMVSDQIVILVEPDPPQDDQRGVQHSLRRIIEHLENNIPTTKAG